MTQPHRWRLKHVGRLPVPDGFVTIAHAIGVTGRALAASAPAEARRQVFPPRDQDGLRAVRGTHARLCVVSRPVRGGHDVRHIDPLDINWPIVEMMADGAILFCNRNSAWPDEDAGPPTNPVVIRNGRARHLPFSLGDGITQLSCDTLDRIWVGYSDDGVIFSADGSVASSAIACVAADGRQLWGFNHALGPGAASSGCWIDECYALNVVGAVAWAFTFPDFDLVRIGSDFSTSYWVTEMEGCTAVAIADDRVLFHQQYSDPLGRCYLSSFGVKALSEPVEVDAAMPDGSPLGPGEVVCRGPYLHYFHGEDWYRGDIRDLPLS